MSNVEILEVEQNYQQENTIIFIESDGENYGVCFQSHENHGYSIDAGNGFQIEILDCDGMPIPSCDHHKIENLVEIIAASVAEFS